MKVLVIDGGGRGHALGLALANDPTVSEVVYAPGNGGTGLSVKGRNVPIKAEDVDGLVALNERERFDLTVVGPEAPLCAGIVDRWIPNDPIWGPPADAARLEGSKIFAKTTMVFHDIPTANWEAFDSIISAQSWLDQLRGVPLNLVVKADGLAAGKGVIVCEGRRQVSDAIDAMRSFGPAGARFIIEDRLFGREASLILLVGESGQIIPLETAQDFKRAGNGDTGKNTGGMGAYSPAFHLTKTMVDEIIEMHRPLIADVGFSGFLYIGLMLTDRGWMVLEYNVRMGDPEAQVILPRLRRTKFAQLLQTLATGGTFDETIGWSPNPAVTVIMTAGGYPDKYEKGHVISGLDEHGLVTKPGSIAPAVTTYHAGTVYETGTFITNGGRVLAITAEGNSLEKARAEAYRGVACVTWDGETHRDDIATGVEN